jgi:hypothetical protein
MHAGERRIRQSMSCGTVDSMGLTDAPWTATSQALESEGRVSYNVTHTCVGQ